MMEGEGGGSIIDVRARDGYRQSVFRSYVFPYMDRPNLTVLTGALVTIRGSPVWSFFTTA
jgi:choline dehydrogenase